MRSKTSGPSSRTSRPKFREEPRCSERDLQALARELSRGLRAGDRVLLEGPMGAGKSTFARALLTALEVEQPPEGSPTFAIAHEYSAPAGEVVHIDFYRLKSEEEIEEAGIPAYFWERDAIVIAEWTSLFPDFLASIERSTTEQRRIWRVELDFTDEGEEFRRLRLVTPPGASSRGAR